MSITERLSPLELQTVTDYLAQKESVKHVALPVQQHLECHIEVTLEQLLKRAGLPQGAVVTIQARDVDWKSFTTGEGFELSLTDTIEVHWTDHREGAL